MVMVSAATVVPLTITASPSPRILIRRLLSSGDEKSDGVLSRDEVGVQDPGLLEWVKPAPFGKPETYFRDLKGEGLKNDSAMVPRL